MTFTADEDQRDVARVLGGERDAFAALVLRHQGRILAHLTRCVGRNDAEDIAQETFVRAFCALARYNTLYPFRGWLLVIASRLAINHGMRRREVIMDVNESSAAAAQSTSDPARTVSERDAHEHLIKKLETALSTLPAESRTLYELRFRQECSLTELAHHFRVSENTLKVRVHRLRMVLAERLGVDVSQE